MRKDIKLFQNQEESLPRELPANVQAEQMLLGAILTNNELLDYVIDFLKIEHFFEPLHQEIYKAIITIIEKKLIATPVTLRNMLASSDFFQEIEKTEYLAKLITMSMMVISPIEYGKIIYDLALRRELINISDQTREIAYSASLEIEAINQIEAAESKLYNLADKGIKDKGFRKFDVLYKEKLAAIKKRKVRAFEISSGFIDLDKLLGGFENSELIILAGRTSMGKTALALNLILNICQTMGLKSKEQESERKTVGFFSLEMSADQIMTRFLSMTTQLDSYLLRTGTLSKEAEYKLYEQENILSKLPIYIDDAPNLSISTLRARAKRLKIKENLGILFVDYLQLIKGVKKFNNRVEEVAEITQGLKALAKELDIPVIALAQLSRAVETRDDKTPILSDLRESGSIEQDADIVMFIYREEYYLSRKKPKTAAAKLEWLDEKDKVENVAEIIVAKNRNGQTGNVQLHYDSEYSKFSNAVK